MEHYFTPRFIPTLTNVGKNYLVFGNLVFYLPLFCFGPSLASLLTAIIGLLSISFHTAQCKCRKREDRKRVEPFMFADMFGVTTLALIVTALFRKVVPPVWYILWVVPLWLYFKADHHVSEEQYAWLHGTWHVTAGILLTALFFIRHKKMVK